jgi:hypothetical protein
VKAAVEELVGEPVGEPAATSMEVAKVTAPDPPTRVRAAVRRRRPTFRSSGRYFTKRYFTKRYSTNRYSTKRCSTGIEPGGQDMAAGSSRPSRL